MFGAVCISALVNLDVWDRSGGTAKWLCIRHSLLAWDYHYIWCVVQYPTLPVVFIDEYDFNLVALEISKVNSVKRCLNQRSDPIPSFSAQSTDHCLNAFLRENTEGFS